MGLCITHATVWTPDQRLDDAAIGIVGDRIVALGPTAEVVCPPGATLVDATGLIVTPGLIDLQVNGAFGYDFTADPTGIWEVAARLPCYGITAFLSTIITCPLERIAAAQAVVGQGPPAGFAGATVLGLHLEGPYLNPQKRGAHHPAYLRQPDPAEITTWSPAQGVRLVTLAPELSGALDLVAALVARGVVVAAGHSAATFAEARAGLDAGIRYGTHLFNAMSALGHREPGLPGALLTDERPVVGLIADGIHVHPAAVNLAYRLLGRRLNLVSDAIAALGMPPGRYRLGDFDVWVDGRSCRLADGTLAGSILSADAALRNLMTMTGCGPETALAALTTTPADLLGLGHEYGRIAVGRRADLVLWSPTWRVQMTLVGGKVVAQV
jgi:N-acetylglucosamine-6-phosphate deacetylase